MPNLISRLLGGRSTAPERKELQVLFSLRELGEARWTSRSFPALAQEGFVRNPVVHRCVRLIGGATFLSDEEKRQMLRVGAS